MGTMLDSHGVVRLRGGPCVSVLRAPLLVAALLAGRSADCHDNVTAVGFDHSPYGKKMRS